MRSGHPDRRIFEFVVRFLVSLSIGFLAERFELVMLRCYG
jgi:hypothetical protein